VRLVGVVVAIDDINARYTVLTLDDGSGANVEAKIIRLIPNTSDSKERPSNTTIDNLNVISQLGVFEVTVDGQQVDIGTVLKTKCTISEFRGQKQLEIKRAWIVSTTDAEAKAWAETAAFKRDVLSTPWHIGSTEHKRIKNEIKTEKRKAQEYERLKARHEARRREKKLEREQDIKKREVKLEARQRKEAVMMSAGALI
jgi:hypothetical protein